MGRAVSAGGVLDENLRKIRIADFLDRIEAVVGFGKRLVGMESENLDDGVVESSERGGTAAHVIGGRGTSLPVMI